MTMQWKRALMCTSVVALAIALAACGGKETMASKSAAAYREGQAKGTPVSGGHEHGGQTAEDTADHSTMKDMPGTDHSTMTAMDHATMTDTDHSSMSGMDHSKMTAAAHSNMAGMDHSKTQAGNMAGMDHGAQPGSTTGMDHAAMPGMQHGAASTRVAVVTGAPRSSAEMTRVEPGATLRPDTFDAPAAAAVTEAAKAAGGGGHGGQSMSSMQTPASSAQPTDHQQHQNQAPTVYTCPMHPEVTSATPGTCPKCGMTLVKATVRKSDH